MPRLDGGRFEREDLRELLAVQQPAVEMPNNSLDEDLMSTPGKRGRSKKGLPYVSRSNATFMSTISIASLYWAFEDPVHDAGVHER